MSRRRHWIEIESSFNHVWRIRAHRSFGERFATFLSAIAVGPLLIFSAMAITGAALNSSLMEYLQSFPVIGTAIQLLTRLIPFALIITAFTFLYAFIPNTRVRIGAALTAGVVAGAAWETLSFAFTSFAAGASNYQAVYATFASAVLFMIWLYLNWLILLAGASIAFYTQHPGVVSTGLREVHFNQAATDLYTLSLASRVGRRFYARQNAYTLAELAQEYRVPMHALDQLLSMLVDVGILARTDDAEPAYVPGVPFDSTSVAEALNRVEQFQPSDTYVPPTPDEPHIESVYEGVRETRDQSLNGLTLKELANRDVTDG